MWRDHSRISWTFVFGAVFLIGAGLGWRARDQEADERIARSQCTRVASILKRWDDRCYSVASLADPIGFLKTHQANDHGVVPGDLTDPWGNQLEIVVGAHQLAGRVRSRGADGVSGTEDDIEEFIHPQ